MIGGLILKSRLPVRCKGPWCLEPFGTLDVNADQRRFDWNNRLRAELGMQLRYDAPQGKGYLELGSGYVAERRFESELEAGQALVFVESWRAWGPFQGTASDRPGRLPGSVWLSVGNRYPTERDNTIAGLVVEQGVTVARQHQFGSLALIAQNAISSDSEGFSWNNRDVFGVGLRLARPFGGASQGSLRLGLLYQKEWRFEEDLEADRITAFLELWNGFRRVGSD